MWPTVNPSGRSGTGDSPHQSAIVSNLERPTPFAVIPPPPLFLTRGPEHSVPLVLRAPHTRMLPCAHRIPFPLRSDQLVQLPGLDLPIASAGSDMIGWSRALLSHTLDAARSLPPPPPPFAIRT